MNRIVDYIFSRTGGDILDEKLKRHCSVIIPAAGQGKRMGTNIKKQYLKIGDKPIILHTIEKFIKLPSIDEVIVVIAKEDIEYFNNQILKHSDFKHKIKITAGGKERQESVYNGLMTISDNTEFVLIHDAARPFVSEKDINKLIEATIIYGACVLGVKVKDTIKIADEENYICNTPDRNKLWAIQTPQGFKKDIILEAHKKAKEDNYIGTDDGVLAERLGYRVKIIEGNYENIKITTAEDLLIGETIIKNL